ncbi:MAG: GNAT family N-acetyltransferase [Deltaproteobacteria bacterium]|nr:GNAT family N-acetyltransferase [Deltaproteobacteria bacterium]
MADTPRKGRVAKKTPRAKTRRVKRKQPLALKDFERQLTVRNLRMEDFPALIEMQLLSFPTMKPWSEEQIRSQLAIFPQGQFCIEIAGRIVGSASSLIVDFAQYSAWHDWKEIADSGFIRNHDPEGDTLYGIEIMVHPEFRGMKLSRRLYQARKELVRQLNLQRIIIAGRIPGYHLHAENMTAREYTEYVVYKDLFDPVLTPQLSNGFVLRGLIPNYLVADQESKGYATHLSWTNVDHVPKGPKRLTTVSTVRVCSVQWQMRRISSFDDFATQAEFYVDVASDYRSDFVLFPELFTLELLSLIEAHGPGHAARALCDFTPQYLNLFRDLALRYHVNIIGGSQFTLEDDELFNIAYLFRRDGTLGKQYKIHVTPNERRWWGISAGSSQEIFETDRGKIAINICYDVEFPELARFAAAKGVGLLFVPYNTDEQNGHNRVRYCAQARCIENHMYVVTAGCVGNLPFVENADIHYAQSAVLSPCDIPFSRNGVASSASANIGQVVMHDVDLELVRRHRLSGTTQNWRDRRTDLYRCVFKTSEGDVEV